MKIFKIAVYAICKNEEKFIPRWLKSMSEADGVFVTDTGSSDNSIKLLKEHGVNVQKANIKPWRFDSARNISLDFVPQDYDICVCTDLDEIFESGWRSELEKHWIKDKTTRASYNYTWSFNDDGTRGISFYIEKIHSRKDFMWIHPVHEVLKYTKDKAESKVKIDSIQLNHFPDKTKSRAQYLPLLELSVKESPEDDRNMHYLGREYMYYQRWDDCIKTLKKHLSLKTATWKDERCASMRYIARAYQAKNDYYSAYIWLYRAIAEAPYLREPYIELALLANKLGNFEAVYHMANTALKIKDKPISYINEAFCNNATVYDLASVSAYYLGIQTKAVEYIKKAAELKPGDERIKRNYEIIMNEER